MCCDLFQRRSISDYILVCESGCLERVDLSSNPVHVELLLVPFLLQSVEKIATGTSKISCHRKMDLHPDIHAEDRGMEKVLHYPQPTSNPRVHGYRAT